MERLVFASLCEFYDEEEIVDEKGKIETRIVCRFPKKIAPYKFAVLPLMKKDGLKEKAEKVFKDLKKLGLSCIYDETGSVGKRYRRQDENGTPYCITIDYETLTKETVTVRDRDNMQQKRIEIKNLINLITD